VILRGRFVALAASVALGVATLTGQQTAFRAGVDVVVVPVSVSDRNRPIRGLAAADFQLLDNGVLQDVTVTTIEQLPVDVTLVIDASASVMGKTLDDVKADLQQMGDMLQPADHVRVVSVANSASEVVAQRPGGSVLPVDRIVGGGTTALYDGLVASLVAYPYADRPQLVFAVTDGRDNSSFLDAERLVELARTSSAVLSIALVGTIVPAMQANKIEAVDPGVNERSLVVVPTSNQPGEGSTSATIARSVGPYRGEANVAALKAAASSTGGLVYTNASSADIPTLFRRVMDDLRAAYVLTYAPKGVVATGWHSITVHTQDANQTVRARSGYPGRR
jgi:uncharacterized protein YegL